MLVPAWSWAYEPRMGDDLKAVSSKEVSERSFPSATGCVHPAVCGPGGGGTPAEPSPAAPTSLLLAKAAACCAQCALGCQRLCTSASFLPQQMVLQPGKAAGNWHQPGLVLGRRRMKQQQGKGLNTVVFFLQGRCMCCFFALALLRARAGMMYVLQI